MTRPKKGRELTMCDLGLLGDLTTSSVLPLSGKAIFNSLPFQLKKLPPTPLELKENMIIWALFFGSCLL